MENRAEPKSLHYLLDVALALLVSIDRIGVWGEEISAPVNFVYP